jgi:hypothetical protein
MTLKKYRDKRLAQRTSFEGDKGEICVHSALRPTATRSFAP